MASFYFTQLQQKAGLFIGGFKGYRIAMSGFFYIAMIVAMFLTLAVLATGLVSMVKGGEFNQKYGNKLMRARVYMQGAALLLFALAMLSR